MRDTVLEILKDIRDDIDFENETALFLLTQYVKVRWKNSIRLLI